ncbi:DUF5684 domain-containing protein [Alicyclobacillus dauci]|uniref:DUF5684 domain-containing protein n=1 Tax=Alicyclobacillus dauci TaxID=1475485 RepID=A0ABY6Z5L0_9BACL|nr:DUF5684 domain-containing protein [Alicyclobacillus dauci]WAH37912.1 DUF5684 domain-containing protein [Alicyclobacillus dauci]
MHAVSIILGIVGYILTGIAFFRLAKLAGRHDIAWFAWVPILSAILQLRLIRKSGWWVLMYLVPIANIVFVIIWQVKLLNAYGKHGAWVLFGIFINIVYYIMWIVWAYSEKTEYKLA